MHGVIFNTRKKHVEKHFCMEDICIDCYPELLKEYGAYKQQQEEIELLNNQPDKNPLYKYGSIEMLPAEAICTKCGDEKFITEFYIDKNKSRIDGNFYYNIARCKKCHSKLIKANRNSDPEKRKKYLDYLKNWHLEKKNKDANK